MSRLARERASQGGVELTLRPDGPQRVVADGDPFQADIGRRA